MGDAGICVFPLHYRHYIRVLVFPVSTFAYSFITAGGKFMPGHISKRRQDATRLGPQVMMHFCQPENNDENDLDVKLLRSAERYDIPFEGQVLKGYAWGKGRIVVLVHGWSSRASHMAFLARSLAKSGFRAIAFDGPAHGKSISHGSNPQTNLPEFCRAIYHISNGLGKVYGLIGHSFGGAAAAFTAAGQANVAGYRLEVEKLVMISSPSGISRMVEHYCRSQGFEEGAERIVTKHLEEEFPLRVKDFEISEAFGKTSADILVIHDKDDKEISIQDAIAMTANHDHVRLVKTSGEGHRKILASRALLRAVKDFLQETP